MLDSMSRKGEWQVIDTCRTTKIECFCLILRIARQSLMALYYRSFDLVFCAFLGYQILRMYSADHKISIKEKDMYSPLFSAASVS